MRILVTGGAGFIASHIADAYLRNGHHVAVLDDLSRGSKNNVHPKAVFYKADVRTVHDLQSILKAEHPHIVNHHAAVTDVAGSLQNAPETYEINTLGTTNVLTCFEKYRSHVKRDHAPKFIFASSAAVYGNASKIPADEKTPAIPLSPYGLSKLLAEELIRFYADRYRFDYVIFRYANIYGPRQKSGGEAGVVPIFREHMEKNIQPNIFGNGTKTRDYVYVDDVVRANVLALSRGNRVTLNIGTGIETNDKKMFETIARALRFTQAPHFTMARPGEITRSALSARRAKTILGWEAKILLTEGIKKTLTQPHGN